MEEPDLSEYSETLVSFVRWFETGTSILCTSTPEALADCLARGFCLPAPLGVSEASQFISRIKGVRFYLQPGLENALQIRGWWVVVEDGCLVLIEPKRPDASRIKTVIHELTEQLLKISYALHPNIREKTRWRREDFANKVAAFVKMSAKRFREQVRRVGLDVELLKKENNDTLAGVARHLRDLIMQNRVFYWCRCEIVYASHRVCPKLKDVVDSTGGHCVLAVDVARSMKERRRKRGALPNFNIPCIDQYRVVNSALNRYIKERLPVFFPSVVGGASEEGGYADLFDMNRLSVLVVPYGKRRTKGFWLIAVHPDDRGLLDAILERIEPEIRGELDWLFSWKYHQKRRSCFKHGQQSLPGLMDVARLSDMFTEEPYQWTV